MAKSEKKISRVKIKKKSWYPVITPKIFGSREVGEMYLTSPESARGRILQINLKELSNNVKDQNAYVSFRIEKPEGNLLHASVVGYRLTPAFVRRTVRKGTDRVDHYHLATTTDGQRLVFKILIVTRNKVQHSVKTSLRLKAAALLSEEATKGDLPFFINSLVSGRIRQLLKKHLDKIYPVKEAALRAVGIYKEKAIDGTNKNTEQNKVVSGEETSEKALQEEEPAQEARQEGAFSESEPSSLTSEKDLPLPDQPAQA